MNAKLYGERRTRLSKKVANCSTVGPRKPGFNLARLVMISALLDQGVDALEELADGKLPGKVNH